MKQTLQKKSNLSLRLSGYAASTGALLALGSIAKSQVVYSGIQNIQINMPDEYMEVDIDGDMINDFVIGIGASSSSYTSGSYYIRNAFGWAAIVNARTDSYANSWITRMTSIISHSGPYSSITNTNSVPIVNGLYPGVNVNSSQTMWSNLTYPYYQGALGVGYLVSWIGPSSSGFYAIGYGDFFGQERYIGIRFYIGTEQHYGWIRVSLGEYIDPVTIIDWAYESTPGVGINTGVPTIEFSGVDDIVSEATQTLSISFSEEVTGFEISDIVVTNGTPANLAEVTEGMEYTVEITANTQGEVDVSIGSGAVNDLDGIGNPAAQTSWIFDNAPPTVVFVSVPTITIEQTVTLGLEFSEEISGLGVSDFNITNGTASNLAVVTPGTEFTIDITATAEGEVTVTLPEGAVTDNVGNENPSTAITYNYDDPSTTGLNRITEESIKIYPNPADDNLHIELENESAVSIINLNGSVLYQNTRLLNETISLSSFLPGIYIVQVKNGDKVTRHRLVIE